MAEQANPFGGSAFGDAPFGPKFDDGLLLNPSPRVACVDTETRLAFVPCQVRLAYVPELWDRDLRVAYVMEENRLLYAQPVPERVGYIPTEEDRTVSAERAETCGCV